MQNSVAIIMPIYNREKFIDKSIQSVLNQTYQNIELILVDDGSTDRTEEICLKYRDLDSRIKYIKVENGGPSNARNIGIRNVNSPYIMFIDSDDFYEFNMVEKMIRSIDNYEISVCSKKIVNNEKIYTKDINSQYFTSDNKWNFVDYLQKNNLFNAIWNKIYLTKIIIDNNINFDTNLISAEDYKFNLDYFNNISTGNLINEHLYNYIANPNSITGESKNNEFFKQISVVDYNKKIYNKIGYKSKFLDVKYYLTLRDGLLYVINSEKKYSKIKPYIKKCCSYNNIKKINLNNEMNIDIKIMVILNKFSLYMLLYDFLKLRNFIKKRSYKIKNKVIK